MSIATLDELIVIALGALNDTLPPDAKPGLTTLNTSVGYVGEGLGFTLVEDEVQIKSYLDRLTSVNSNNEAPPTSEAMQIDTS